MHDLHAARLKVGAVVGPSSADVYTFDRLRSQLAVDYALAIVNEAGQFASPPSSLAHVTFGVVADQVTLDIVADGSALMPRHTLALADLEQALAQRAQNGEAKLIDLFRTEGGEQRRFRTNADQQFSAVLKEILRSQNAKRGHSASVQPAAALTA